MRALLPAFAAFSLLACGGPGPTGPAVEVEEAWVRLPAVPGRPAAAYFTLRAYNADIPLVSVVSDDAEGVELHESLVENGVTMMRPLNEGAIVPAGGETAFEPGGQHAMLFGLDPDIRPGGSVSLTFNFNGIAPITVNAEARDASGDPAHQGH